MEDKSIYIGSKFFTYFDNSDEPEIRRIYNVDKINNKVKYFDKDNNKGSMKYDELINKYKMLKADAIITFSIVKVGDVPDVIVALKRVPCTDNIPYAICRQSIYDFFTNNIRKTDFVTYVGVSASQDTCPADINFTDLLQCTDLQYNKIIVSYLDDNLEDILRLFNHKKYNDALRKLHQNSSEYFKGKTILGYNDTLKDLLTNNNFMYDFRKCFNVIQVPFIIDENSEGLSNENILFLENELKVNIMETYVLRYTKEINLNTIKRDYVLVASLVDNYSKIYIVGYDTADGEYAPRTSI